MLTTSKINAILSLVLVAFSVVASATTGCLTTTSKYYATAAWDASISNAVSVPVACGNGMFVSSSRISFGVSGNHTVDPLLIYVNKKVQGTGCFTSTECGSDYEQCFSRDIYSLSNSVVFRKSGFYSGCDSKLQVSLQTVCCPNPTAAPTVAPSNAPSEFPTYVPTAAPTVAPSILPTVAPSLAPTDVPTVAPTEEPTAAPSQFPTEAPTAVPSEAPTMRPSAVPTVVPTSVMPTLIPTRTPSRPPTRGPTVVPTAGVGCSTVSSTQYIDAAMNAAVSSTLAISISCPTGTTYSGSQMTLSVKGNHTLDPLMIWNGKAGIGTCYTSSECSETYNQCMFRTLSTRSLSLSFTQNPWYINCDSSLKIVIDRVCCPVPTMLPTVQPSRPTNAPTFLPTFTVTDAPTIAPSSAPTQVPTNAPTAVPTAAPSFVPSAAPTVVPTARPSAVPTAAPSAVPTTAPSVVPTAPPSDAPTVAPSVVVNNLSPTEPPTLPFPTEAPTFPPSAIPSRSPTSAAPSLTPTRNPTRPPTRGPTVYPTAGVGCSTVSTTQYLDTAVNAAVSSTLSVSISCPTGTTYSGAQLTLSVKGNHTADPILVFNGKTGWGMCYTTTECASTYNQCMYRTLTSRSLALNYQQNPWFTNCDTSLKVVIDRVCCPIPTATPTAMPVIRRLDSSVATKESHVLSTALVSALESRFNPKSLPEVVTYEDAQSLVLEILNNHDEKSLKTEFQQWTAERNSESALAVKDLDEWIATKM